MKLVLLALVSLIFSVPVIAQEKFAIYGDGGGSSPVMSINIDKTLSNSNGGFGFKAGVGMVPGQTYVYNVDGSYWTDGKWKFSLPLGVNYLVGNDDQVNFLELALQGTFIPKATIVDSWSSLEIDEERIINRFMPSAFIGYRRNPVNKGVVFRIGYNPIILDKEYISWFSASVGWKFTKNTDHN